MRKPSPSRAPHRHKAVTQHVLRRREGVPYEVARIQCSECQQVLEERTLRRATA